MGALGLRQEQWGDMVPSSQLRVYEPLESFPEELRARWAAYIEADVAAAVWQRDFQV